MIILGISYHHVLKRAILYMLGYCHDIQTVKPCLIHSERAVHLTIREHAMRMKISLIDIVSIYLGKHNLLSGIHLIIG